jgi:low affinity Fe/Cu permease
MNDPNRIEQFNADIESMRVKTSGNAAAERAGSTLGFILMVAALVVGIGSYVKAGSLNNALDQNELVILGFTCVSMAIIGAALWLRAAVLRFWRFWMLRSLYEGQAHLDEVVKAIRERD